VYSGISSIALGAFFDVEGAFNKTLFKTTATTGERHRLVPPFVGGAGKQDHSNHTIGRKP
jgi:hypothetical protein